MRAPTVAELKRALGDPTPWMRPDGTVAHDWENEILNLGVLPGEVPFCGDLTRMVATYRVHKLLLPFFRQAFSQIALVGAWGEIKDWGGTYAFRVNRNNPAALSAHCWGAAVDLNPIELPNGSTLRIAPAVVDAFARQGFVYGGNYGHPDPQHFECSAELLQKLGRLVEPSP